MAYHPPRAGRPRIKVPARSPARGDARRSVVTVQPAYLKDSSTRRLATLRAALGFVLVPPAEPELLCFAKTSSDPLVTIWDARATDERWVRDRRTSVFRASTKYGPDGFAMDERERAGDSGTRGPVT